MKSYKKQKQKPKKTHKQKGGDIPSHLLYPLISLIVVVAGRLLYNSFKDIPIHIVNKLSSKEHNENVFEYFKKTNIENQINDAERFDDNTLVVDSHFNNKRISNFNDEFYDDKEFYGYEYEKALEAFK